MRCDWTGPKYLRIKFSDLFHDRPKACVSRDVEKAPNAEEMLRKTCRLLSGVWQSHAQNGSTGWFGTRSFTCHHGEQALDVE